MKPVFGMLLAPAVADFSALHPELGIELVTNDRIVDLVKEGMDLAVRLGWLRDSSLRATKLGEFEQYVVAAPEYFARVGSPTKPEQLQEHAWIALSQLPSPLTWRFTGPGGDRRTVRVNAKLRVNTGSTLRALLESGAGISALDSFGCEDALQRGRLERVLARWSLPVGGIYVVYPPGRHIGTAARAFAEFFRNHLKL